MYTSERMKQPGVNKVYVQIIQIYILFVVEKQYMQCNRVQTSRLSLVGRK